MATAIIKPSRSEEIPVVEEQLRKTAEVRELLDASAPRRVPKPARSDPSADLEFQLPGCEEIPELQRLLDLRSLCLQLNGGIVISDEYSENDYYKDLNAGNGEHYTTGAGFIQIENQRDGHLKYANGLNEKVRKRSNSAMNDWEPNLNMVFTVTSKPARSDPS